MTEKFIVSYSQFETYNTCPWKYKLKYIDKIKVEFEENEFTLFGNTFHDVLNKFYDQVPGRLSIDSLIELWNEMWNQPAIKKYFEEKLNENRHSGYDLRGRDILEQFYDRQKTENNLTQPLLREQNFRVEIGDFTLIGRIDRIDKTAQGDRVIDYKLSLRNIPLQQTVDESSQLTFYYLGANKLRGKYPNDLALYYVAFDEMILTRRSHEDVSKLLTDLQAMKEVIGGGEFKAQQNPLCGFCEYQPECPHYRYIFIKEDEKNFVHEGIDYHIEDVIDNYILTKVKIKRLDETVNFLRPIIIDYMQEHKLNSIPDKITLSQTRRSDISFPALFEACKKMNVIPPLDQIRLTKELKSFVDKLPPEIVTALMATVIEQETPQLRIKSQNYKSFEESE